MASNQDIARALQTLAPTAIWNLSGGDLTTLQWLSPDIQQPTADQINATIAAYVPPPSLQDQIAALQAQITTLQAKVNG